MKKTIEQEINEFLEIWDVKNLISFLECSIPLTELYDVEEHDDWVKELVDKDQVTTVRLIRTVYLLSKLAELHSGRIATTNIRFKNLWRRLEKIEAM